MNIEKLCDENFIETLVGYENNISEIDEWYYGKGETKILVKADDIINDYNEIFGDEGDRDFEECNVTKEMLQEYKGKILFLQIKKTSVSDKKITVKTVEKKEKVVYVYTDTNGNEVL